MRLVSIFRKGDIFSKLSFFICGLSNIVRGQIVKGLMFLLLEISYIVYMARNGIFYLKKMVTLGTVEQGMIFNESIGIYEFYQGDNSMLILLYGVVTCVITASFLFVWAASIKSGEESILPTVICYF